MKTLKWLLLGLLAATPLSLSAATNESFLVLVMGGSVQQTSDGSIVTGDVRVIRKDAAGVSTGVRAAQVVVERDMIRCMGDVTVTLGGETLQVREIAFATRGAQVLFLNPDGIALREAGSATSVFNAASAAGAKPATEFNHTFPKTDSGLTGPRTWKVERLEDFKVRPVPQTLQSPGR